MALASLHYASVPGTHPLELEFPVDVPPEPPERRSRRAFRLNWKNAQDPKFDKPILHRLYDGARDRSVAMGVHPNKHPTGVGQPKHDDLDPDVGPGCAGTSR